MLEGRQVWYPGIRDAREGEVQMPHVRKFADESKHVIVRSTTCTSLNMTRSDSIEYDSGQILMTAVGIGSQLLTNPPCFTISRMAICCR